VAAKTIWWAAHTQGVREILIQGEAGLRRGLA
jgi:hypothetical protein